MPDPAPLGDLIDAYYKLREDRNQINKQAAAITQDMERLKLAIIEKLDSQKSDLGRGQLATGSIKESIVPTIKDFVDTSKFIYRHKAIHLMETRISAKAYREFLKERGGVPGLEPFTRRDLNVQVRSR